MTDLEWLLHPTPVEEFLENHWAKRPLLVERGMPDYYAGLLALDDVDELITSTSPAAARSGDDGRLVRTDRDGTSTSRSFRLNDRGLPDIQDIYRAYRSGYSVVLNQIHHRSATVAGLCRGIEAALQHRVNANLYLTPRESQGFRRHADQHDVLVAQVNGTKQWVLDGGGTMELGPGDLLYVPSGVPHEAITATAASLHLTIGIHAFTAADLICEVVSLLVADGSTQMRAPLPAGFALRPPDAGELDGLSAELATALQDQELVRQAMLRLTGRLYSTGNPAVPGQFRSIDRLALLNESTRLRRAAGIHSRVRCVNGEPTIEFAGNYVSGPPVTEPALRYVATHDDFTAADLPGGLALEDRLGLIDRLVSEGLLAVEAADTDGERSR